MDERVTLKHTTIAASILIIALACSTGKAQRPGDERQEVPSYFFYEAVNLASQDSTLARIDVHYRIETGFFVAVRNDDREGPSQFCRRGEIAVELTDSADVSVARILDRVEIPLDSIPEPEAGKKTYVGVASFRVQPGRYKLVVEASDNESPRRFLDRRRIVNARLLRPGSGETSDFFMTLGTGALGPAGRIAPQNFGGGFLFGSRGGVFLEFASPEPPDTPVEARITFAVELQEEEPGHVIRADTIGNLKAVPGLMLSPAPSHDSLSYDILPSSSSGVSSLLIPLPLETLPLRPYRVTVSLRQGSFTRELSGRVRTIWPDMPFSLRDVEYAIRSLRYIASAETIDSLLEGDLLARWSNLERFWSKKDRTPHTAMNETMAQYYRRVDYATRTFGTIKNPNGFATDRGRIHVIYGLPTRIDRSLDPVGGFREIWSYDALNRKFTFVDEARTGNYVLLGGHAK